MERDVAIPQKDIIPWLNDHKSIYPALEEAYKNTVPSIILPLTNDVRFCKNDHIVNKDFGQDPRYIAGFFTQNELLILTTLYVYPVHRKQGYSTRLLRQLMDFTVGKAVLQVAVETDKLASLDPFYKKLGFKTLGIATKDDAGNEFVDYFWSYHKIDLTMAPGQTHIMIEHHWDQTPDREELVD